MEAVEIVHIIIAIVVGAVLGYFLKPKTDVSALKENINRINNENKLLNEENKKLLSENSSLKTLNQTLPEKLEALSARILKAQTAESKELILKPFAEEMKIIKEGFDKKITDMNKNTDESKASLEQQLKFLRDSAGNLQKEAAGLANALKNKKEQGNWGEFQLEKIFEILGFAEGREFTRQEYVNDNTNEKGRFTDYILNLPNNRRVIIDSKVSLESYIKFANATDPIEKDSNLKEFIAATKNHIKGLGSKDYQRIVKDSQLDYVFMFMPLEHAYLSILEKEPSIYQFAFDNNVAIVTPSLILPMMRTIDSLLKIDKQNKNIGEVIEMVNSLYEKYVGFTESFDDVGKKLNAAQKSYDDSVKRLSTGAGNMNGWIDKIKNKSGIKSTKVTAIGTEDE